jgi:hypothetical protein
MEQVSEKRLDPKTALLLKIPRDYSGISAATTARRTGHRYHHLADHQEATWQRNADRRSRHLNIEPDENIYKMPCTSNPISPFNRIR